MAAEKKYKLIKVGRMENRTRYPDLDKMKFFQIQALRDIPLHGVKAGDLGGYVTSGKSLSQEDNSWVGGQAQVVGIVKINGDAYVGDSAHLMNCFSHQNLLVSDKVRITGNAKVHIVINQDWSTPVNNMQIFDSVSISGNATIENVKEISNNVKISGEAHLQCCENISGNAEISGKAKLYNDVNVFGDTQISGDAVISRKSTLRDCIVEEKAIVNSFENLSNVIIKANRGVVKRGIADTSKVLEVLEDMPSSDATEISPVLIAFNEIKENIASYQSDIVKIIKYPVMTDGTDSFTRAMVKSLNQAQRLSGKPESPAFFEAISVLEDAFIAAESNAMKIASTALSEADLKKVGLAKDLLAIASNEVSSDNEKKVSFKQAFKQLEGVVVVPEIAMDAFRIKIGLQELEM